MRELRGLSPYARLRRNEGARPGACHRRDGNGTSDGSQRTRRWLDAVDRPAHASGPEGARDKSGAGTPGNGPPRSGRKPTRSPAVFDRHIVIAGPVLDKTGGHDLTLCGLDA
jgi:hypothetical protein